MGSIDLGVEYKEYAWTYFLYRQNFYETNHNNRKVSWEDGLTGFEMRRHNQRPTTAIHVNTALVEVISTMDHKNLNPVSGQGNIRPDSYYNQAFYQSGWSYKNRGLGNPLIASRHMIRKEHAANDDYLTNNNRILALHTGFKGAFYKVPWMLKATYSQNYGSHTAEYAPALNQFSFYMNAEFSLKKLWGTKLQVGFSGDLGELYYNSLAVNVGISKSGIL